MDSMFAFPCLLKGTRWNGGTVPVLPYIASESNFLPTPNGKLSNEAGLCFRVDG